MAIKATISIDDDRWAKHPYGVSFDDEECNKRFGENGLNSRDDCYIRISSARRAGFDIDTDVEEYFY